MARFGRSWGGCVMLILGAVSCGSDADNDPGAPGGTGGSAGNGAAGSAAGGTSAGAAGGSSGGTAGGTAGTSGMDAGQGGSGATGGTNGGSAGTAGAVGGSGGTGASGGTGQSGTHCSPGTLHEAISAYVNAGGPMSNCNGYDPTRVGLSADERIFVRNIALKAPQPGNQPMAYSIGWTAGGASLEFWATNEVCGAGAERLGTGESRAPNISCVTLSGSSSYSNVLMVWRNGGGQHGDVTVCPMGSCSP